MISIISRPYDGLTSNYNPVYNGLPFVVTSDMKYTPSFRYVCEIYSNGSKIGELRHNPNISSGENGIFDIGRILEDYITYELPWKQKGLGIPYSAYKDYYVSFGEEVSRGTKLYGTGAAIVPFPSGTLMTAFTTTTTPIFGPNVKWGQSYNNGSILIQGTSRATLNKAWKVAECRADSKTIIINTPFVSGADVFSTGYIIQGFWSKYTTYIGGDGMTYYQFTYRDGENPFISQGDTFTTYPDVSGNTYTSFLNGTSWNIVSLTKSGTGPTAIYTAKTNIPYQTDISAYDIHMFPLNNAVKRDLFITKNDKSVAWNGVFQYEDFVDYQPTRWSFKSYNTSARFLTKRPRKTIQVCPDQYFTFNALGNLYMPPYVSAPTVRAANSYDGYFIEGISTLTYGPYSVSTAGSVNNGSSYKSMYTGTTLIVISGDISQQYTDGSYITVAGWTKSGSTWTSFTNTNKRVIASIYNSSTNRTYVIVDLTWNSLFNVDGTHAWTLTLTQRIRLIAVGFDPYSDVAPTTSTKFGMSTIGAGPQNIIDLGFTEFGSSITSYKVTPYAYTNVSTTPINGIYKKYVAAGETWDFTISCPCDTKWKKYTIMWMNELGGFDYYDFTLPTDKKRSITRNTFNRKLKSYQGTKYTYSLGERGTSTFNTNSTEGWTLRTDFINQETIDWLIYIYESPEVYIIDKSYTNEFGTTKQVIFPVTLTTDEPQLLDKRNMGETGSLKQMIIDVVKSNGRNIQRGSNFGGSYFYNRS